MRLVAGADVTIQAKRVSEAHLTRYHECQLLLTRAVGAGMNALIGLVGVDDGEECCDGPAGRGRRNRVFSSVAKGE